MARWQWRPWAYATLIPQIAWTVRQVLRWRRPSYPIRQIVDAAMDEQWRCKPLLSAHSWMVVVITRPEQPRTAPNLGQGQADGD